MEQKRVPQIAIFLQSEDDLERIKEAEKFLKEIGNGGIPYIKRVLSPSRTLDLLVNEAARCEQDGVQVIIAGSGTANHLACIISACVMLPVIGLPLTPKQGPSLANQLTALASPSVLPNGHPLLNVGIDQDFNAAFAAVQILAIKDPRVKAMLQNYRNRERSRTVQANEKLL